MKIYRDRKKEIKKALKLKDMQGKKETSTDY